MGACGEGDDASGSAGDEAKLLACGEGDDASGSAGDEAKLLGVARGCSGALGDRDCGTRRCTVEETMSTLADAAAEATSNPWLANSLVVSIVADSFF
jgi:hypothetical protein